MAAIDLKGLLGATIRSERSALGISHGILRLLIRDNGIGFDVKSAQAQAVGLGLIGIKERAALAGGRAKIISSPKKGTTIEVSLPLTFRPERQGRRIGK